MFDRSASSGLKSINCANMRSREKSAVDIVNAMLLLIEMERKRFISKQKMAWQLDNVLTPKGHALMKEVFEEINVTDNEIPEVDFADYTLFML